MEVPLFSRYINGETLIFMEYKRRYPSNRNMDLKIISLIIGSYIISLNNVYAHDSLTNYTEMYSTFFYSYVW